MCLWHIALPRALKSFKMGPGTKDLFVVLFDKYKVTVGLMQNNKGKGILTQEL